ncbi:phage tail tape measure protein [Pseudomonas baltica]|uniref:phage tail tape measure protein n=1 Tax=Pseudomonas baltica TaxID=2762576 RepID=UPI00289645E4|nr:phage tail tape measure protein [Pseudomonas baltica]
MTDKLKLEMLWSAIDKVTGPLRNITAGSNKTVRALKEARDAVKELNAQQANVTGYARQREAVRQSSEELAKAQDKLRQYREQLKSMDAPSAKFQKTFANASAAVDRLSAKHGEQRAELQRLIPLVKATGADTGNLGATQQRLAADIQAANAALQTQKDRLAAVSRQQARVAKVKESYNKGRELQDKAAVAGASSVATGAAAGMPVLGMIKNYSAFEDAMAGVAKQVDGARDANGKLTPTYYAMGAAIKTMAEHIPMATTDIAALVEGGARMGIQGKDDLLEFARVAATAATAFDLPADQIGESLARIAEMYKIPIKDVSKLGDAINYLDDNAMSKGADIIDVMQRTAGITASVGMSFKDAAALGSTFLTLGSSAEIAGTATNAMIRELAIATQQPKRFQLGLKAIGLEAKKVQEGMTKDATGTIEAVLDAVNKLPKGDQLGVMTQLFGKEYGDDAAKLAANMGEYRRQLDLVRTDKGNGSMQREGDIKGDLLSARLEMTKNRLFNLSSAMGETLRPALVEFGEGVDRVLTKINAWVQANPGLVQGALKAALGIAAVSTGFGAAALAVAGAMGPFLAVRFALSMIGIKIPGLVGSLMWLAQKALPMVGQALLWVGRLAMANPITATIAAIAVAAYLIYKNWDAVKSYFGSLWAEITQDAQGGIAGVLRILTNFSPLGIFYRAFAGVMSYFGVELPAKFTDFGGMILSGLATGISNGLGAVKSAITNAGESTISWFKEKLGIHSPSRVFAQLGGFTMEGLAQGLNRGQSEPLQALASMSKRFTQAGALALGVGASSGALAIDNRAPISAAAPTTVQRAGDSIKIEINAAPGMDPAAIARAVSAELDRRQSAKQARGRSSLFDQE